MKKITTITNILLALLFGITTIANAQWLQVGQDIDGEAEIDASGYSVCLSSDGSVVAIGAMWNNGVNGFDSGHVRIYENISGVWIQTGEDIDGEAAQDRSGQSVSLSSDGSVVAIGAEANDGSSSFTGHVRIYQNISGVWTQIGQDIDGEEAGDWSGESISLSSDGSIVAIGARGNDGIIGYRSGHVRIYENISGIWMQIGQDIEGEDEGDLSGESVSLNSDGSIVAIGATENDGSFNNAGHVRIYENISGIWTQIGQDIDGEAEVDFFGHSVCLNSFGSIVAIGSRNNRGNGINAGHVRIYENISGTWMQIGQDIDGEDAGDWSGHSVSLSSDGSVVAIGAMYNDGVNGYDSGHVRIYQNISGVWIQIGQDIDGEAEVDNSGYSVSLSSDGSVVSIGAIHNGGNGNQSGQVRVFNNLTIGTDELLNTMNVSIYPNPTKATITIKGEGIQNIKIRNTNGQLIRELTVNDKQVCIDLSQQAKGVYLIYLITGKSVVVKKVVVQ